MQTRAEWGIATLRYERMRMTRIFYRCQLARGLHANVRHDRAYVREEKPIQAEEHSGMFHEE